MKYARLTGSAALIGSAFLWASAYIFVKHMVDDLSPCLLLALRFSAAAILLLVIFFGKLKCITRDMLLAGIKMGTALFFEFFFFTVGIKYTEASKASFIIASYIILLPGVYYLLRRKKPAAADILGSLVCMAGVTVLMAGNFQAINGGDVLSGLCAVAYAVHVVYSADYAKTYDGGLLNLIQISTAAVFSWISVPVFGGMPDNLMTIPYASILYLALVCTILPYFLCLFGMKYVSTTTSGILLSFESVFATTLAVISLHEPIYWQLVVGGALIVGSFIISEAFRIRKTDINEYAEVL